MDTYLDQLMTNHQLMSNSSDEEVNTYSSLVIKQKGGDPDNMHDKLKHIATGSFPPIYLMTKEDIKKEEELEKTRAFSKPSVAVSIKEIMKERRDKKPFISL